MIEKIQKRGQGAAKLEPYDVKLTLIAGKKAVGISLRNKAKEAIAPYKSVELYIDRDERRVYFVPIVTDDGYLVRPNESKSTIYFQCREVKFLKFIKKLAADSNYVAGYLRTDNNGYYIEVPV